MSVSLTRERDSKKHFPVKEKPEEETECSFYGKRE